MNPNSVYCLHMRFTPLTRFITMNVPIRLGDTAFMCFCYYKRWNRTLLLRAVLFDTTLLSLGAACTTRYTTLQWKFATFPASNCCNQFVAFYKASGGNRNLKPPIWKTGVLPLELHWHKCNLMANHRLLVATNQCFSLWEKHHKIAGPTYLNFAFV